MAALQDEPENETHTAGAADGQIHNFRPGQAGRIAADLHAASSTNRGDLDGNLPKC